jgi:hypothetical protein
MHWHLACSSWLQTWHAFDGGQIRCRMIEGARAVLTSRPAKANSALWPAAQIGTAILLSVVTWTSAGAGNIAAENCVRTARSLNCVDNWGASNDPYVRTVPDTASEAEKAQLAQRDHRWLAHCRPLVQRDSYGVARYYYAAPGCEFGIGSD